MIGKSSGWKLMDREKPRSSAQREFSVTTPVPTSHSHAPNSAPLNASSNSSPSRKPRPGRGYGLVSASPVIFPHSFVMRRTIFGSHFFATPPIKRPSTTCLKRPHDCACTAKLLVSLAIASTLTYSCLCCCFILGSGRRPTGSGVWQTKTRSPAAPSLNSGGQRR